nr:rab11 family-interacting protein 3 isoform X2 [Anolis sagrei ordinatus]
MKMEPDLLRTLAGPGMVPHPDPLLGLEAKRHLLLLQEPGPDLVHILRLRRRKVGEEEEGLRCREEEEEEEEGLEAQKPSAEHQRKDSIVVDWSLGPALLQSPEEGSEAQEPDAEHQQGDLHPSSAVDWKLGSALKQKLKEEEEEEGLEAQESSVEHQRKDSLAVDWSLGPALLQSPENCLKAQELDAEHQQEDLHPSLAMDWKLSSALKQKPKEEEEEEEGLKAPEPGAEHQQKNSLAGDWSHSLGPALLQSLEECSEAQEPDAKHQQEDLHPSLAVDWKLSSVLKQKPKEEEEEEEEGLKAQEPGAEHQQKNSLAGDWSHSLGPALLQSLEECSEAQEPDVKHQQEDLNPSLAVDWKLNSALKQKPKEEEEEEGLEAQKPSAEHQQDFLAVDRRLGLALLQSPEEEEEEEEGEEGSEAQEPSAEPQQEDLHPSLAVDWRLSSALKQKPEEEEEEKEEGSETQEPGVEHQQEELHPTLAVDWKLGPTLLQSPEEEEEEEEEDQEPGAEHQQDDTLSMDWRLGPALKQRPEEKEEEEAQGLGAEHQQKYLQPSLAVDWRLSSALKQKQEEEEEEGSESQEPGAEHQQDDTLAVDWRLGPALKQRPQEEREEEEEEEETQEPGAEHQQKDLQPSLDWRLTSALKQKPEEGEKEKKECSEAQEPNVQHQQKDSFSVDWRLGLALKQSPEEEEEEELQVVASFFRLVDAQSLQLVEGGLEEDVEEEEQDLSQASLPAPSPDSPWTEAMDPPNCQERRRRRGRRRQKSSSSPSLLDLALADPQSGSAMDLFPAGPLSNPSLEFGQEEDQCLAEEGKDSPSPEEAPRLRAVFEALDRDGDGFVRIEEFVQFATVYGAEQVKDLTRFLDPAGLGVISFEDFYRGISAIKNGVDPDNPLCAMGYDAHEEAPSACPDEFDDFVAFEANEVTDSAYMGSESTYSECETFTDEDTGTLVHHEMHDDIETDSAIDSAVHSEFTDPIEEPENGSPSHDLSLTSDINSHSIVTVITGEEHFEDYGEGNEGDLFSESLCNGESGFSSSSFLSPSTNPLAAKLHSIITDEAFEFYCTQCHKHINRLEDLSARLSDLEMNSPNKRLSSKKVARHLHQTGSLTIDAMEEPFQNNTQCLEEDITDKVIFLEKRVTELEKDTAANGEHHSRLKQENLQLVHRANALEEQLKEQELKSDEILMEEIRKQRELLSKMEREKSIEIENLQARLQQLDDENSELRSCVPCLKANIERLEEEKRKLLDEIEDLTVQLNAEQENKKKLGDKLNQERHQFQKDKESTQELIEDLRKQLEHLQLFKLEAEQRRGRSSSIGLQEYNSRTRETELEQEIRRLKQDNRTLKDQNDELNGQIINLSIQGAKNLFSASFSESLAAEISSVSRDELMEAIQKQEEINYRLQDYIDRIIVAIMETNPSILEVK